MRQNKKQYIRIDFIFSYWILFWFIGYQLKLIPFNPKDDPNPRFPDWDSVMKYLRTKT